MTPHVVDDLPRLLRGDATQAEVQTAAVHLRECADCRQELVDAVTSHAALTSAQRFAPEAVSATPASGVPVRASGPLPDLSAVFAQVRAEAASEDHADGPTTTRRRAPMLAAAAAVAGLLVGGGAVAAIHSANSSSGSSGRTVALAAYDVGTTSAKATITTAGQMSLDAVTLPKLAASKRYEVWLTNTGRTRMQPIGWVGTNGKATLTVPAALMNRYNDIEVSVQRVDTSSYTYSGTSVLRGSYA
jgi:hypothetical protein